MATKPKMALSLDLRGLDLVTPVDLIDKGHTPFAKNFRLYAQQSDDRRVAVSNRKGPGFYTVPLNETLSQALTSSVGASRAKVGTTTSMHLQPFTAPNNDRVTQIELMVSNQGTAYGPLRVSIYDDNAGRPGKLLGESSILTGGLSEAPSWQSARFHSAPKLELGSTYYIYTYIQDDGDGFYDLETTTDGVHSLLTSSSLFGAEEQTYALLHKVHTSPDLIDKGSYRFERDNGENITIVAFGDKMYRINESTKEFEMIADGLSPDAIEYNFDHGDNKVFWVNSFDVLTTWDGTTETGKPNLVANPSFTTNTTGWTSPDSATLERDTVVFNTSPASLKITGLAANNKSAATPVAFKKGKQYKITYWANVAVTGGNSEVRLNGATGSPTFLSVGTTPLVAGWQKITKKFYADKNYTTLELKTTGGSFTTINIDSIEVITTGLEHIIDNELPILSDFAMHKDRAWGVDARDKNRLVFSENPGNPAFDPTGAIPTEANEQWYYAWLSVSFIYVPRPYNGSPITKIISFQDSLQVFTQDKKYVISGYDRGSFTLREATGVRGALSSRSVVSDENKVYFVSGDGLYEYNGAEDVKISSLISPIFDGCAEKKKITPVIWKNEVRFYFAANGSPYNDSCLVYNKDMKEFSLDTKTFINRAIYYGDADDNQELIEFSSLVQTAYSAEQDYNSLGAPIDFEYRMKYDSLGSPAQRKRINRYFPLLQGVDSTFPVTIGIDKDFQDSPRLKKVMLTTNGSKIGKFTLGDGTLLSGDTTFTRHRQTLSGYANYWQMRLIRNAVNNRVAFIGAQYSYKTKRL